MTKRVIIILLFIMLGSFITAGIIFFDTGGFDKLQETSEVFNREETIDDISTIEQVYIKSSIGDITIINTDTDEVKVTYSGTVKGIFIKYENDLLVTQENNTIYIEGISKSVGFMTFHSDHKLTVYLPTTYDKKIDISSATGDITLNDRTFNQLTLESNTGDITVKDVDSNIVMIETDTGDIELNNLTTQTGNISSDTGDITGESMSGSYTLETDTGDMTLSPIGSFSLDIETDTGDILLKNITNSQIKISTDVGDIEIKPEFDGTDSKRQANGKIGNGDNQIDINTATGDIEIE